MFELILLERLQTELGTVYNQFGLKKKLGTEVYFYSQASDRIL